MSELPTNFVDNILSASMNEKKHYMMIQNSDGTVSFEDVSTYDQVGSSYGAAYINKVNGIANECKESQYLAKEVSGTAINVTDSKAGTMLLTDCTKNLCPNNSVNQTYKGITLTKNSDGSVSLVGTATEDATFSIYNNTSSLPSGVIAGGTYTASIADSIRQGVVYQLYQYLSLWTSITEVGTTNNTFTLNSNAVGFLFRIKVISGSTVSCRIYPQIEPGSVAHPYVPYSGYNVTACGKNMADNNVYGIYYSNNKILESTDAKSKIVKVQAGETYAVQASDNDRFVLCVTQEYPVNNLWARLIIDNNALHEYTLTVPSGYNYLVFYYGSTSYSGTPNIQVEKGAKTAYEAYEGNTVTVTNDTPTPVIMQSYDGITNISSDGNVTVSYAVSKNGVILLDSSNRTYELLYRGYSDTLNTVVSIPNGKHIDDYKEIAVYLHEENSIIGGNTIGKDIFKTFNASQNAFGFYGYDGNMVFVSIYYSSDTELGLATTEFISVYGIK